MTDVTIEESEALRQRIIEARLGRRVSSLSELPKPIARRSNRLEAPLSATQRQLWYLAQLYPESRTYNEITVLTKMGDCDIDALRQALTDFVGRHEAWRTHFASSPDGNPYQVIDDVVELDVPLVDLSKLSRAESEARAADLAAGRLREPFDLSGRLMRPWIVRMASNEHRLYLALHHIIFDGVTLFRIYLPEIAALYGARVGHAAPALPEPLVQYPDYAAWEVDYLDSPPGREKLRWWREHLIDVDVPAVPLDYARPAHRTHRGGVVPLRLKREEVAALRGQAERFGATLFQLMAAVYSMWLRDWTGSVTPTFGTVTDFRFQRPELATMAGYCLAPLVLRADLSEMPSLAELTAQVRGTLLEAMTHAVPFEPLVRELEIQRDPHVNPLFQTMFSLEPPPIYPHPDWSLCVYDDAIAGRLARAKFDVNIELDERAEGHIAGQLLYDADLFHPRTAQQMADHFCELATTAASGTAPPLKMMSTRATPKPPRQSTITEINGTTQTGELVGSPIPETPTQRRVTQIWAQLLDLEEVDVHEDFFDSGGHSLLAVRLVARIQKEYGVEMSIAQFLERGRTVAGLSRFIDAGGAASVNRGSSRRTLFFIFPDAPTGVSTRHLRSKLGDDWPVVPLNPPQSRGRYSPAATVEVLALDLLRQVRTHQPAGPYRLAGYSFGGLLAYEMARQLAVSGETTEWLAVIDAPTTQTVLTTRRRQFGLANRLRRFAGNTPNGRAAAVRDIIGRRARTPLIRLGLRQPGVHDFDFGGALRMSQRYGDHGNVDSPLELFVAEASVKAAGDETLGWAAFHPGPLHLHPVPGDHVDIFRPPLVDHLANILLDNLRSADAAEPV